MKLYKYNNIFNKKLIQQIIRFLFVGGTAFIIDAGILFLLAEKAGIHYLISNCISFTVSVIYNYVMSVLWVFETTTTRSNVSEVITFLLLSIIGLGINSLIMWIMVARGNVDYIFSKIIATTVVMIFNFISRKYYLEK